MNVEVEADPITPPPTRLLYPMLFFIIRRWLQLLQQGPPEVLAESTTYAPVVEEIGQMWCLNERWTGSPVSAVANSGGRGRGAGSGGTGTQEAGGDSPEHGGAMGTANASGTGGGGMDPPVLPLDPTLSRLISRLATMIVEKVGGKGVDWGEPSGVSVGIMLF